VRLPADPVYLFIALPKEKQQHQHQHNNANAIINHFIHDDDTDDDEVRRSA
jgi:hypothetical protein